MASLAENVFHVVTLFLKGRDHVLVLQIPIAGWVVELTVIMNTVLYKNAYWFPISFANQVWVNMAAANIYEAAD